MSELIFPAKRANKLLQLQRQNDAVALLLDGFTPQETAKLIVEKYRCTPTQSQKILGEAKAAIKLRLTLEVNALVTLHLTRYEEVYKELKALGAEIAAMEALKAKELLLGFHRTGFHMRVSAGQVQQVWQTQVSPEYDLTKLDNKARQRYEELVAKAKRPEVAEAEKYQELQEWKANRREEKLRRAQGAILV